MITLRFELCSYAATDAHRETYPVSTTVEVAIEDRETLRVTDAYLGLGSRDRVEPWVLERLVGGRAALREAIEAALERHDEEAA